MAEQEQVESPWEDAYGARFVTCEDVPKPLALEIVSGEWVKVFCRAANEEHRRLALYLRVPGGVTCRKPLVVNKTSAGACGKVWGPVAADGQTWNGKTVRVASGRVNGKLALMVTPIEKE